MKTEDVYKRQALCGSAFNHAEGKEKDRQSAMLKQRIQASD